MARLMPACRRVGLATLPLLACVTALADDGTTESPAAASARRPLWEIGIGGAFGGVSDYPASDRYHLRGLPIPYFVYRGELFRSDQDGARLRAKVRPDVELDISSNASFPVHSDSTGPRAGMPGLDYLFELGPNLKITFNRPAPGVKLLAELPLRAAFSTNWQHIDYRGLIFSPDLAIQDDALFGTGWRAYADIGPQFTSARLQDYFYEVDPQYAIPGRPAYQAHGGYLGSRLEVGASRALFDDVRLFFYGRLDNYDGAENRDSPLWKSDFNGTVFVGFAWSFLHSKATVDEPLVGADD